MENHDLMMIVRLGHFSTGFFYSICPKFGDNPRSSSMAQMASGHPTMATHRLGN